MAGGQCRFTGSPLTDSLALLPHVAGMTKKEEGDFICAAFISPNGAVRDPHPAPTERGA